MAEKTYFTEEGLEKLKQELQHLKNVERPAISQQIAEARDKGDLSENAEYDAAKDAQGMLEARIAKLEETLASARVLDESQLDTSKVTALSTVRVFNYKANKEMKYKLVSEKEANAKEGKISVKSPIGKGLLGRQVGDVVEVEVPAGVIKFEVLEITIE
jgi:transcription elongation factor GreA